NKRSNPLLKMGIEQEKTRVVRPNNINWISMVRLSTFISLLILGVRVNESLSSNRIISQQYEEIFSFLQQFFIFLESSLPKEPGNVRKSILGHEAIQNAIAIICYKNIVNKHNGKLTF